MEAFYAVTGLGYDLLYQFLDRQGFRGPADHLATGKNRIVTAIHPGGCRFLAGNVREQFIEGGAIVFQFLNFFSLPKWRSYDTF